jgi:hypothetical protein
VEVFIRREDADRFVEDVHRDDPGPSRPICGSRSASSRQGIRTRQASSTGLSLSFDFASLGALTIGVDTPGSGWSARSFRR